MSDVPFPGEVAGASLKPKISRRCVDSPEDPFPGEVAGASLKLERLGLGHPRGGSAFPR